MRAGTAIETVSYIADAERPDECGEADCIFHRVPWFQSLSEARDTAIEVLHYVENLSRQVQAKGEAVRVGHGL